MIKIEKAKLNSNSYNKFKEWILAEWGEVDLFIEFMEQGLLPLPILAFKDNKIVGGLQFSFFSNPEKKGNSIWINALYIEPSNRKQGIASILIKRAEEAMTCTTHDVLFVYTDKPSLYLKCGWEIIEKKDDNFVLKIKIK